MEPVKRVPLVHQVEDQIEKLIKEEAYAPGTKLPTDMICTAELKLPPVEGSCPFSARRRSQST